MNTFLPSYLPDPIQVPRGCKVMSEMMMHGPSYLPDPIQVPRGCKVVSEMMMHGPCGAAKVDASCMQNGPCNKNFPKKYNNKTFFDSNRHVKYRRRDTGVHVMKRESKLDNCNVIPYNRALCLAFEVHINVEGCKVMSEMMMHGPSYLLDPIQVPRGCKVVSEMMMHGPRGAAKLDAS
nr:DNA helicase [Tanacetum cinerariifolium]